MHNHTAIIKYLMLLTVMPLFQQNVFGQSTISDTVFISRDTTGGIYHAIYIEHNKNSKYYDWITNFKFDHYDSLAYQASIKAIFEDRTSKRSKTKISVNLPRTWCGLNSYKDEFYLYAPSEWGNNSNIVISDTSIIRYSMEGPYAYLIDDFRAINDDTFEFSVRSASNATTKITLHLIDWENQIAILDNHAKGDAYRYSLLVGSDKARQFPIIVNYCKEQKQVEFSFDETDFEKLLTQKE